MAVSLQSSSRTQLEPNINITPLVDVVLVLLIIFMVIAPALEQGVSVKLPSVSAPDGNDKKEEPITLSVDASGQTFLEKEALSVDAIAAKLQLRRGEANSRRIVIKGDQGIRYQVVRELFQAANRAGFRGVSLLVSKKEGRT